MTTKVTVDAHAGWPVHVTTIDQVYDHEAQKMTDEWRETGKDTVPANEKRDFYVTSSRRLIVEEGNRD
ncbi:hypothetical protein EOA32_00850 [Mesorhizobium sp. M1A.F.Ca.ET.072.01.1.1]|uniref:hypothetical protein n=1 Tax=Mesorhizobium sp. M1A.F.Ca.ET.072.01.1.1 TaxID=2496753 RepID=UPI000FD22DF4|nr:hypothetical protein [Mesorhizobium sp. M1A.F.Ca.ET.072.01.1.1]RUW55600.1 hypothetical protein EOA32_00850 [Mesorhizobium sp. M1A.F.Ca.ET.072.01.1.1]